MEEKNTVSLSKHIERPVEVVESHSTYILSAQGLYLTERVLRSYFKQPDLIITWKDSMRAYLTFSSPQEAQKAYLDSLRWGSQLNAIIKPFYGSHDEVLRLCKRKRIIPLQNFLTSG
ncbi:RRM RNA binding protein involved in snRNA processing Thc1 [Schizosaccharomyces pombe]|uniref:Uncharacterized protein C18B5.09c n=1 Tax=Schizosaccharomyces pombe (strain 972 / ATCC 24843) TaxID=284812 RepID=YJK9_SCHPO|nr:uncharacterized protein SPCC18B5.09c [Schizosaccharomyces pombe]Q9USL2.1 RecName: Full=Uncharacterized protein C18B5.09c [Schizosaccharomyces pombe 972h-]CAB52156.1 sequence orphan [Schizosaccharomyces pombe]|eukprot:NP_587939.1 uncharacterized protein SPCC18B5.09c [Schizosaccharomyces pombe]